MFYPYKKELRVSKKRGKCTFDGDFGPPPAGDLQWPPFRSFGDEYYTYQLLLDLNVGQEWAVRTEPHPRFYTDTSGTVPIAVPALLRTEWWPMINFVVFKAPAEGCTRIFRPGEPMLRFNLSHSQAMALYAFTHAAEVGIDIEYIQSDIEIEQIAEHFFSTREVAGSTYRIKVVRTVLPLRLRLRRLIDDFDSSVLRSEPVSFVLRLPLPIAHRMKIRGRQSKVVGQIPLDRRGATFR